MSSGEGCVFWTHRTRLVLDQGRPYGQWNPKRRALADVTLGQFFFRAVSGVDADPNLVHMEAQDLSGGKWEVITRRCP